MRHLLTEAELARLVPAARPGGTLTLWGRDVPWRPVSVGDYVTYIVGRYESARAFFVMGAQVKAANDVIEEAREAGREPDPELLRLVDGPGYLESTAKDAAEANAAFIACGLGHAGNANVIRMILDADDDELQAAMETIERGTWGDDPAAFFGRVGRKLAGRQMTVLSASRTSSSTPTKTRSRSPAKRTNRKSKSDATRAKTS